MDTLLRHFVATRFFLATAERSIVFARISICSGTTIDMGKRSTERPSQQTRSSQAIFIDHHHYHNKINKLNELKQRMKII
jgi:hypothetical protein